MNRVLIYIFAFMLILTLSLGGYYWYVSARKPEPKIGKVENEVTNEVEPVTLSGQVLIGATVKPESPECFDEFYLVSGDRTTWLGTYGNPISNLVSADSEVELSGSNDSSKNPCLNPGVIDCGCDDFLVVEEVRVLTNPEIQNE